MSTEQKPPAQRHTPEYKAEGDKLVQEIGNGRASVERGVPLSTRSHWAREARAGRIDRGAGSQAPEVALIQAAEIQKPRADMPHYIFSIKSCEVQNKEPVK